MKRLAPLLLLPLLGSAGCVSTATLQQQNRELTWRLEAAESAAEQATVDKRLAQRETGLAQQKAQAAEEKLALAYDALREARTKLDEKLQERLTELAESNPEETLTISQYGGVVLESGILFRPGRHELTAAGKRALQPMVRLLNSEEYAPYEVELAGHTDRDPIKHSKKRYRDNYELGALRANSVRVYLAAAGVAADRIFLSSWGPSHPLDGAGKANDRRVEIRLHTVAESLPASASR